MNIVVNSMPYSRLYTLILLAMTIFLPSFHGRDLPPKITPPSKVHFQPIAQDDHVYTNKNISVSFYPVDNDIDESEPLTNCLVEIVAGPSNGEVEFIAGPFDCFFIYIPNPDFVGTDTLTYTICNSEGLCDEAQVFITVNPCPEIHILSPEMICEGEFLNLTTNGNQVNSIQWFKDGALLSTLPTIEIPEVTAEDEAMYTVTVINEMGCQSSNEIYIEVVPCNYMPLETPPANEEDFGLPTEECCCCETSNTSACNEEFNYLQDLFPFMPPPGIIQGLNQSPKRTQSNIAGPSIASCWTNAYTGNFFLWIPIFQLGNFGPPLQFDFFYNSGNAQLKHGYGNAWSHTFNLQWERADQEAVLLHRADGQIDRFINSGSAYLALPGVTDTLEETAADIFKLVTKQGVSYFFDDPTHRRLTRIEDPFGNDLTITYTDGLPTHITAMGGRQLNLTYENELLTTVSGPQNRSYRLTYEHDGAGNSSLKQITNPQDNHWGFQYDSALKLIQINNLRGDDAGIEYNDNNAVERMTSTISDINMTYIVGSAETVVNELVNGTSQESRFQFDPDGRVTQILTNCCGFDRQFTYDDDNNITQITNARGGQSNIVYDDHGNVVRFTGPFGANTEYAYEPMFNQLAYTKDQNGNVSSCDFNPAGRLVAINMPKGVQQTFTYTTNGQVATMTNGNGHTTAYQYNTYGDLIRMVDPIGEMHYGYDESSNQTWVVAPLGDSTHYEYDELNQMIGMTDALSYSSTYTLDENGNRITITDKRGFVNQQEYDSHNRLIRTENPLGEAEHFEYDAKDNLIRFTDPVGNETVSVYNERNLLSSRMEANGDTWSWEYDELGNKTKETDPTGYEMRFGYNELGRMTYQVSAAGETIDYEYDGKGNTIMIMAENGMSISLAYDSLDRLTQKIYPDFSVAFQYDENSNIIQSTDGRGQITTYSFDARDRQTSASSPLGFTSTTQYDLNNNTVAQTDLNGNTSFTQYALNRPIAQIDALGTTISQITYDEAGNRTTVTNAQGESTAFTYDEKGQVTRTDNALGNTTYNYDNNGNLTSVTDALGRTTAHTYDEVNRRTSTVYPDGTTTQTEYDGNGNVSRVINENGDETNYTFNELNQLISQTNAEGESTTYQFTREGLAQSSNFPNGNTVHNIYDVQRRLISQYDNYGTLFIRALDENGNVISESDGLGNTTTLIYDADDRLIETIDSQNQSVRFSLDANANRTSVVDREGNTNSFVFDALNRLTSQTDALGYTTNFAYDIASNQLSVTDGNGNTTNYEYDTFSRLTKEIFADGTTKQYSYDALNRLVSRRDQNGDLTQYSYDARDRLITRNYPGTAQDASFTYDSAGRLITASNSFATLNFTIDRTGRILSETLNGQTTSFSYDVANNLRSINYPSGRSVMEYLNARGQLTSVDNNGSILAGFRYDSASRLIERNYSNLTQTYFSYNTNNWTSELRHRNATANFAHFRYSYDREGNKQHTEKLHRNSHSETYQYDNKYRLVEFKVQDLAGGTSVQEIDFSYDQLGNRQSMVNNGNTTTYTTNTTNEYTSISSESNPVHDANGNLLSNTNYTFQYDYENRVVSVNNGAVATYEYDVVGRRIRKTTPLEDIHYYYDEARVIEEHYSGGSVFAEYVYGNWIDDILWMSKNGNEYFYHPNALGSIAALSDVHGQVVEYYEYDAYGNVSILNSNFDPLFPSISGNPYLFTGRRLDSETGLYYYRARYYDAETGRFLQHDPLGYVDGWNLFEYVGGAPTTYSDPFGLTWWNPLSWPDDYQDWKTARNAERARKLVKEANSITKAGKSVAKSKTYLKRFGDFVKGVAKKPVRGADPVSFLLQLDESLDVILDAAPSIKEKLNLARQKEIADYANNPSYRLPMVERPLDWGVLDFFYDYDAENERRKKINDAWDQLESEKEEEDCYE